jgi:hypothetical protein
MAKIKKALKALLPYSIALIVGLFLTWICTPYAKAHRADPTLTGGEVLLPILAILAVAFIKSFKKADPEDI